MNLEEMVRALDAYQNNSKGFYRGISRSYYPKWVGWKLLGDGKSYKEIEEAVIEFYLNYYYYQLHLDLIEDPWLALVLFNFAVNNGKKKAMQKIVLCAGATEGFNRIGSSGKLRLLLELLEFHEYIKDSNTYYIWKAYKEITNGMW